MNYPIPPSINSCYAGKTRRYKSVVYKEYEIEARTYALINKDKIEESRKLIKKWLRHYQKLKIKIAFEFYYERLYTKKNTVKKLDVDNYVKPLLDNLTPTLHFDDSLIFYQIAYKKPGLNTATIYLKPF
jgi:Holliday junction resolvase RusA-like endonuclease